MGINELRKQFIFLFEINLDISIIIINIKYDDLFY